MVPFPLKGLECSLFGKHLPELEDARTYPLIVMGCIESLTRIQLITIQTLVEDLIMIGLVLFAALGSNEVPPRGDDRSWMGQQHPAPAGQLRKIHIGIEPSRGSQATCLLDVVHCLRVVLRSNPDEQIIDRSICLWVENRFARDRVCTLPELRFVNQVDSIWQRQGRIKQEVLKWTSMGRRPTLGIDPSFFTLSAAARFGKGFWKVIKHVLSLLSEWSLTVYATPSLAPSSALW
jgi:hypothetical protein